VAGIWVIALGQDVDMVGGGIRPGVAGPQRDREQLGGVVAPHTDRVVAEAAFRCCCRVLLFAGPPTTSLRQRNKSSPSTPTP